MPELYGVAPGSFAADMIERAGGEPITTGDPAVWSMPLERLVEADPEVILLGDAAYGVCPDIVAAREGWGDMTAVKEGAIRPVNDIVVTRPGPRLAEGLASVARGIHPELDGRARRHPARSADVRRARRHRLRRARPDRHVIGPPMRSLTAQPVAAATGRPSVAPADTAVRGGCGRGARHAARGRPAAGHRRRCPCADTLGVLGHRLLGLPGRHMAGIDRDHRDGAAPAAGARRR